MKFYKVHYRDSMYESRGSHFFTTRIAAEKSAREFIARMKSEQGDGEGATKEQEMAEIEEVMVAPTKKGILAALNIYATHPDNG